MNENSFLDRVHGQHTRVLLNKLRGSLLDHSPKSNAGKRAYGCFVFNPIITTAGVLDAVVRPIELVATAAIHLVAAAFVKDKKAALLSAKRFILILAPLSTLGSIVRLPFIPLEFLLFSYRILKDPIAFEMKQAEIANPEGLLNKLNEILKDLENESHKKFVASLIARLEKGLPISTVEGVRAGIYSGRAAAARKARANAQRPNGADEARAPRAAPQVGPKPHDQIIDLAKKYGMEVAQSTIDALKNPRTGAAERKEALKYVIRRLQLALHPDKTARMPEQERKNREEDFTVLNNAQERL